MSFNYREDVQEVSVIPNTDGVSSSGTAADKHDFYQKKCECIL